jgi:exopolysaccharide production protein ExoZ
VVRNIQVLRCFAALAVVVRHMLMWLHAYLPFGMLWVGRAGVDVFFVISGFIMFYTNPTGQRTSVEFWTGRLIRIAPLYWIAMLPVIVLFFAGLPDGGVSQLTPEAIVQDFLFIPHVRGDGDVHPLLNVGWTLTYEMFFYLLFGLTFVLRSQIRSLVVLSAVFLGAWLLSLLDPKLPYALQWYAQPITLEFAGGGLLALLYNRLARLPKDPVRYAGFALMGLGLLALFIGAMIGGEPMGEPTAFRTLLYGPPAMAIVAGALMLETSGVVFRSNSLLLLGDASYSIYLVHTLVLVYAAQIYAAWFTHSAIVSAVIGSLAVIIAIAAGLLAHVLIEKPLTARLKSALAQGRRPAASSIPAE